MLRPKYDKRFPAQTFEAVYDSPSGLYLELSHHFGVAVPALLLAPLQLEGVAEVCESGELRQILQFVVVHLWSARVSHSSTLLAVKPCL